MGRLIRLLAANRDIKIQECGKQDTAERGGLISGCGQSESDPFARSWRISNTAFAVKDQYPKFANAFNSHVEKCHRRSFAT